MTRLIDVDLGTERPTPDIALLFYASPGLATVHKIQKGFSTEPQIGEGRMVCQDDLEHLSRIFGERKSATDFILPERVLGAGSNWLTWYAPAAVRTMLFSVGGERCHLDVVWPSLIFHAAAGKLFAAAYEGSERPGPSTAAFMPPLMNFYDSTAMCRGSARYPAGYDAHTIPAWESAVFDSYFTHTNNSQKIAGCSNDEDQLRFWKHPARRKHPLKARHMIPIAWAPTAGEWLNALHNDS